MNDAVIKSAKKLIKRNGCDEKSTNDLTQMCMKDLAVAVMKKMKKNNAQQITLEEVKEIIGNHKNFIVDDKIVSLKRKSRKRKSVTAEIGEGKRTKGDVDMINKWRKDHKIVLRDVDSVDEEAKSKELNTNVDYFPFRFFDLLSCQELIHQSLINQCTQVNGFSHPSPIQAQCWPILLQTGNNGKRRDIVGIAETGSGKTLAFAIPALATMSKECISKSKKYPRMLVLAPTRELAMQSHKVIEEFGACVNLNSIVIYGGVPKHTQTTTLRKRNIDCIVGTPGRLKDLIQEESCNLSKISQLILDEADRMLDMGFEEDVKFIISKCLPKEKGRQTAMFSATWPAAIQKIALEYMVDPIRVYVGFEAIVGSNGKDSVDDSLSANKRVEQNIEVIDDYKREARLLQLLEKYGSKNSKNGSNDRILIFALYKKEAARIESTLKRLGWNGFVNSIHGDKSQDARTRALEEFKSGKTPLLVATDVAARGLDIPNVEIVINYTFPLTIEDYVHRIGRTGRAGKNGKSFTFFQPSDKSHAGELQQVIKQAGQNVTEDLMKFGSTIKKKEHKLYGNFGPKSGPMKKATKITFDSDDE
mmetsp:Transcript_16181/g.23036  ORF Transcript_16181/g.23036 Transcript_16181/m.23036 type:complete len:588 (+) Transcript_16181:88-1851(+)